MPLPVIEALNEEIVVDAEIVPVVVADNDVVLPTKPPLADPPPFQVFVSVVNPFPDILVVKDEDTVVVMPLALILCVCDGRLLVVKVTDADPPVVDTPLLVLERPSKKVDCKFGVTTLFPLFVLIPKQWQQF